MFPAIIGLLMVALVKGQSEGYPDVTIDPAVAIRRVNAELKILTKVTHPIDSCRVILGNDPYRLIPNAGDPEVAYFGRGLEYGECGVHIARVHEDWNGNVTFILPPQGNSAREVSVPMRLIVALPPNDPELLSPPQPTFTEGDQFTAQCRVMNGRPAANISWYLDEQPLVMGTHQPVVTWDPATDTLNVRQNVTMVLSADDDGARLDCVASHEAFDEQKRASRQLAVHYAPKRLESGPITIFGLKIGSEGRLNVTVRANPAPSAAWTVGSARLVAPQATDDGLITALSPVSLGNGYYEITLVLARVAKEDVDRAYNLLLTNELGQEEVTVRISTMDEPVGVELGAGAIVGIVIAVLILLIAVSMVVFAKATQRWCFAGGNRGRDHTRSSGESSDTESAVGGRERSRLAGLTARVRAALPRSKDKVQATDAPTADAEEKPLSEEKKGVVYAELVLSEQPAAEKPAPPATEYAEIVYTDQPVQQAETKETTN